MIYLRNCPVCNKELSHKTEKALYQANWSKRPCRSCSQMGHNMSEKSKNKMSLVKIGKPTWSSLHRKEMAEIISGKNHPMYGKHHTEEMKRKQSERYIGRSLSEETKKKLRISAINQHRKNGISFPAIDSGATEYFNNLNEHEGFHIQHPNVEIKDLGYFIDGYDPILHAVFEYDTKIHNNRRYREKDLQRQTEIIKYYNNVGNPLSHFFRIKSGENKMIDIFIEYNQTANRL